MTPSRDISRLIEIMAALRTPVTGCPWDLEQDFKSVAPYTIEEAYEVADAIERGDMAELKLELGDLLLQSVYHARMAEEEGLFDFGDVVEFWIEPSELAVHERDDPVGRAGAPPSPSPRGRFSGAAGWVGVCFEGNGWRSQRESNPCLSLERAPS